MTVVNTSEAHTLHGRTRGPSYGAFVISLDFELQWGVRDHFEVDGSYRENLLGARLAIPRILDLFEEFGIAATWAVVGFLFARSRAELEQFSPKCRPRYENARLDPYAEVLGKNEEEDPLHYAPSLIDAICRRPGQEIGTHTFSHYWCLESGHSRESFSADIQSAIAVAAARGVQVRSLVFPRDQVNPKYRDVLLQAGITSYRGNGRGWMHRPLPSAKQGLPLRCARALDRHVNISGQQVTRWDEVLEADGLCNVRASRFLMPYSQRYQAFEGLRFRRIIQDLQLAAKRPGVFHLWWHPHNFGIRISENLCFLRRILEVFAHFRREYGMESLTMGEVADLARGTGAATLPELPLRAFPAPVSVAATRLRSIGAAKPSVGCLPRKRNLSFHPGRPSEIGLGT